jgi:hypothetical protein
MGLKGLLFGKCFCVCTARYGAEIICGIALKWEIMLISKWSFSLAERLLYGLLAFGFWLLAERRIEALSSFIIRLAARSQQLAALRT